MSMTLEQDMASSSLYGRQQTASGHQWKQAKLVKLALKYFQEGHPKHKAWLRREQLSKPVGLAYEPAASDCDGDREQDAGGRR
jgi:hypothetical protein